MTINVGVAAAENLKFYENSTSNTVTAAPFFSATMMTVPTPLIVIAPLLEFTVITFVEPSLIR